MTTPHPGDPRTRSRAGTRPVALALFALVLAAYILTYSRTFDIPADEGNMFLVTESLVKYGRASVDQGDQIQYISQASLGRDGARYAKYGIGQSLAAAPLYALGLITPALGLVDVVLLLNPLVSALTAVVLMLTALALGAGRGRALATALIYAFCTPAWVYGKGFFSEPLVALGYALACWGVAIMLRRQSSRGAALAGAGIALATLVKTSAVIVAPVLLVVILRYGRAWPSPRRRFLLAVAAPIGLAVIAIGLYNWLRFGTPLNSGYGTETFSVLPWIGAAGMLFAPGRSLFIYAPVMLVAVPGLWLLRRPAGMRVWLIGAALSVLLLYGAWWSWWGAWAWGPRYLVPVLPVLSLGLLGVLGTGPQDATVEGEKTPLRARRPALLAVGVLAALGFLIQLPGLAVFRAYFFWDVMKVFPSANPDEVSLYSFSFFMPLTNLREALKGNLDFAWKQGLKAPLDAFGLLLAGASSVIGAAGLLLAWRGGRAGRAAAWLSLLLVLASTTGSLAHYQRSDDNPFISLMPAIDRLVPPNAVLLAGDHNSDTLRLLWNANRSLRHITGLPGDAYWVDHLILPLLRRAQVTRLPLWYLQTESNPPAALWTALAKMGLCSTSHPLDSQIRLVQWTVCVDSTSAESLP